MNGPTDTNGGKGALLERLVEEITRLHFQGQSNSAPAELAGFDKALADYGRAWLRSHAPRAQAPVEGPDVYIATQLYKAGGHSALLGDFVRARGADVGAQLIVTNVLNENRPELGEAIRARTGLAGENIAVLEGPSLYERLEQLFVRLLTLRPGRLFHFQHPGDPLSAVVAQPSIAAQQLLVHHADATPTFGLHSPGMRIIDLNPVTAAATRSENLDCALLLLTSPDPGPRPHGFLGEGALVTGTCGANHKYTNDHAFGYADTVAAILQATSGRHVHFGPLDEDMLGTIAAALAEHGISGERFVHVRWVSSLPEALWQHGCDLYFSSYPIDGARADVDVAASATPQLRWSRRPLAHRTARCLDLPGILYWHDREDLAAALREFSDGARLKESSALIRSAYEQRHHPDVFRASLTDILNGGAGLEDPDLSERVRRYSQIRREAAKDQSP